MPPIILVIFLLTTVITHIVSNPSETAQKHALVGNLWE